jgi:hypothetical protein
MGFRILTPLSNIETIAIGRSMNPEKAIYFQKPVFFPSTSPRVSGRRWRS